MDEAKMQILLEKNHITPQNVKSQIPKRCNVIPDPKLEKYHAKFKNVSSFPRHQNVKSNVIFFEKVFLIK